MDNHRQEHKNDANNMWSFLAGLLIGGLAGAGAMLLLAPQSGKKTRAQIQRKSIELRDQTTEAVEDAVAQAGVKARQITADVHEQAESLQQRGQDMLGEQKERLSTVVEAGKTAVQGSRG
jgi:gas vesicle protein